MQPEQALKIYKQVLDIREKMEQVQEIAAAHYRIAQVEEKLADWTAAITSVEAAIKALEAKLPTDLQFSTDSGITLGKIKSSFSLPSNRNEAYFGIKFATNKIVFGKQASPEAVSANSDLDGACTTIDLIGNSTGSRMF